MRFTKGYADLNIPTGGQARKMCETAIERGYSILALNTRITTVDSNSSGAPSTSDAGGDAQSSKKGKGGGKKGKKRKWEEMAAGGSGTPGKSDKQSVPLPPSSESWIAELESSQESKVRILQRLTIVFDDIKTLQTVMSHENIGKYDILAVLPTNSDALVASIISTSLSFDIITFDLDGPYWIKKLRINRVKGALAANKDIVFEIKYSACLQGDTALENIIYTTNSLLEHVCVKRFKNMIISSGAETSLHLRAPKDVIALSFLLGLDEATSSNCLQAHTHRIVDKADSRKYGKTSVAFIPSVASLSTPPART